MNLIAIVDRNWGIAIGGEQIVKIPEDLRKFRELTTGCPIVYGRKTLLKFPDGKPLPDRDNYVLSRKIGYMDGVTICRDISDIPTEALERGWCTGGESVYHQLLPYCEKAYITYVDADFLADQFCPNLGTERGWELRDAKLPKEYGGFQYQFRLYERTTP